MFDGVIFYVLFIILPVLRIAVFVWVCLDSRYSFVSKVRGQGTSVRKLVGAASLPITRLTWNTSLIQFFSYLSTRNVTYPCLSAELYIYIFPPIFRASFGGGCVRQWLCSIVAMRTVFDKIIQRNPPKSLRSLYSKRGFYRKHLIMKFWRKIILIFFWRFAYF